MGDAQILDKAQGALIGSALGDAIGIFTGTTAVVQGLPNSTALDTSNFQNSCLQNSLEKHTHLRHFH